MFQKYIFPQCSFPDQHDSQASYEHRSDTQSERYDKDIFAQCKRTDDSVKWETRIQYFQVEEERKSYFGSVFSYDPPFIEQLCYAIDYRKYDDSSYSRNKERKHISAWQKFCNAEKHQKSDDDLYRFKRSEFLEESFYRSDPMIGFFEIQEEIQRHHEQECSSKSCNDDMRWGKDIRISCRIENSKIYRLDGIDLTYDRYDDKRENDSHAKDGNGYSSCQESMLPFRIHFLQHRGIDDRVIERQWCLQHSQDEDDKDRLQSSRDVHRRARSDEKSQHDSDDAENYWSGEKLFNHPLDIQVKTDNEYVIKSPLISNLICFKKNLIWR